MYGSLVTSCVPRILLAVLVIQISLHSMTRAVPLHSIQLKVGLGHVNSRAERGLPRMVMLRNTCSDKLVQILPTRRGQDISATGSGSLYAQPNKFATLLMKSMGDEFGSVAIISNRTKEYLCFSPTGRMQMRTNPRKHCTLHESEHVINGETVFQYSLVIHSEPVQPQTFYLGFRNNGKKLRGHQWSESDKFRSCTYFKKEQNNNIEPTQDPHAPDVDFEKHWHQHGSSDEHSKQHVSSDEQLHSHGVHLDGEAPNDNAPYAPPIHTNQKQLPSRLVNTRNGHRVRHSGVKSHDNT